MPKKLVKPNIEQCPGGRSFGRKKGAHDRGGEVCCYRCHALMGCVWCCESPQDLICLACHNWADKRGVKYHGDVEVSRKIQHVHTDRGWRHWDGKGDNIADPIVRKLVERN